MLSYLVSLPRRLIPPEVRGRIRVALRLPSRGRREANAWLRQECASVRGKVLSIGSGNDSDGLGDVYRSYFPNAESYTTSEVAPGHDTDLIIDVRDMRDIPDASYDAVFCCGVLEHVDDCYRSMDEISRILAPGGILLLGLPFRQGIHMEPNDYWRFTEFSIRWLLRDRYEIEALKEIDRRVYMFPAAYLARAVRNEVAV